ncbi:unnamed protein product [Lampetra fluviatilis]
MSQTVCAELHRPGPTAAPHGDSQGPAARCAATCLRTPCLAWRGQSRGSYLALGGDPEFIYVPGQCHTQAPLSFWPWALPSHEATHPPQPAGDPVEMFEREVKPQDSRAGPLVGPAHGRTAAAPPYGGELPWRSK